MRRLQLLLVLLATAALPAFAKAPPGQGRKCKTSAQCEAPLECVKGRSGATTCELPCKDGSSCPEDQRCLMDGAEKLCRPIIDI